ncbi:MAG: hypothetical protein ACI9OJ_004806 [Myxococcota bacterium]|jgi:hypothetical protein
MAAATAWMTSGLVIEGEVPAERGRPGFFMFSVTVRSVELYNGRTDGCDRRTVACSGVRVAPCASPSLGNTNAA